MSNLHLLSNYSLSRENHNFQTKLHSCGLKLPSSGMSWCIKSKSTQKTGFCYGIIPSMPQVNKQMLSECYVSGKRNLGGLFHIIQRVPAFLELGKISLFKFHLPYSCEF